MNEYDVICAVIESFTHIVTTALVFYGAFRVIRFISSADDKDKELLQLREENERIGKEHDRLLSQLYKGGDNNA